MSIIIIIYLIGPPYSWTIIAIAVGVTIRVAIITIATIRLLSSSIHIYFSATTIIAIIIPTIIIVAVTISQVI